MPRKRHRLAEPKHSESAAMYCMQVRSSMQPTGRLSTRSSSPEVVQELAVVEAVVVGRVALCAAHGAAF